jgi:hypothetical protein
LKEEQREQFGGGLAWFKGWNGGVIGSKSLNEI